MRRAVVLAGTVALTLALGGRSDAQEPAVTVQLFQFKARVVEVKAGERVTWTNQDDIAHTVTSGEPERPGGRFDLPLAGKGATASLAFTEPGVHAYHCARHPHMRGEVHVK